MQIRDVLRNILKWSVKQLARLTLWRFKPGIIGVTGSVGKTSAKRAIAAVLSVDRRIRASPGNLNNDLGLPVAIIGQYGEREATLVSKEGPEGKYMQKLFFWARLLIGGVWRFLFLNKRYYPEILVLEYGADKPGDIKYLLSIARPNVSVITAIGRIPVHTEFYPGPEDVAREKSRLIESLTSTGFAVLNRDDATVMELKNRTRAHVMTFGCNRDAEVNIERFEHRVIDKRPVGISFKLEYGGSFVPVRIDGALGRSHAYAAAAAGAVGIIFGKNLVSISEALMKYSPLSGRMSFKNGINGSYVLDDSYNASPLSMGLALQTLFEIKAKRKIAILGDMREIGRYSEGAHKKIGGVASECADVIVTVGGLAKNISDAAIKSGMRRKNVFHFMSAEDLLPVISEMITRDDLVLVKGSHAVRLDKIVEKIVI